MSAQDPELHSFQYRIDLTAFAKHAGYEVRARDEGDGLTLLEHPNRDRVVVARCPDGAWIYASANRYEPRGPEETRAEADRRLRDCIARTKDKGTIVDFVRARDGTARTQTVGLECIRERLRDYMRDGVPLDVHGPLCPPPAFRERMHPTPGACDAPKDRLSRLQDPARGRDGAASPRVLVVTASPSHAVLYYEQHGQRLGHTNATAAYMSVGAERPRSAAWDLQGIDRAMTALPAGSMVVAALPPAGDRLAHELQALSAGHPQLRFERQTVRIDRDKALHAPGRASQPSPAFAPSRGR